MRCSLSHTVCVFSLLTDCLAVCSETVVTPFDQLGGNVENLSLTFVVCPALTVVFFGCGLD